MKAILRVGVPAIVAGLLLPAMLPAQQPDPKAKPGAAVAVPAADPKLKGVWEAVNYPADLHLNDVYFATPDIGWVSAGAYGKPGMILHTKDAGANWTAQLGDPESKDPSIHDLRFIDAQHGWVLQDAGAGTYKLLHTSDGEEWSPIGPIEDIWGIPDYTFISPNEGLRIDGNDNVSRIMRTSDAGRTWTEVFACQATMPIEGLTKNIKCALKTIHFPSNRVGYALGGAHGAKRTLFVAKTEDGGQTWKLSAVSDVGGDTEVYFRQEAFFTDEATGVVSLSDKRIYRTTDGGQSWKAVVGTPGPEIRFTDPAVGWSFPSYRTLSFTTDGGKRWSTRDIAFPEAVKGFSLPRRDRGYVVGEHGMIYRYRVIGPGENAAAKVIPGPAMPLFDSALDERVAELDTSVDALEAAVAAAPEAATAAGATPSPGDSSVAQPETGAVPDAPPDQAGAAARMDTQAAGQAAGGAPPQGGAEASAFTATCCSKPLGKLDLVLTAVTGMVPEFLGQYKNTNLLVAGLHMLTDLPARINQLNGGLRAFRKAPDKASAMSALQQVSAAIAALRQSTAIAFQKQAPPPTTEARPPAAAEAPPEAKPDTGQPSIAEEAAPK